MRFLMLNWRDLRNPLSGGAERVSHAYLAELQRRGHDVWWFANDFPGAQRQETVQGIPVVRGGGRGSSVREAIRWYRKQPPFDLVIDQHHGIPWYAPWWSGAPCVAYIHEVLGPIWKSFYPWPACAIGQFQERWTHWLYRNVPFWTPSDSTRRALHSHGVRSVNVFPNGTDTAPLPRLAPKPLNSPLRLIAVSRLAPNKRVGHIIAATKILLQRGVPTQLTVVGGGEETERLRAAVKANQLEPHVAFSGQLTEAQKNAQLQEAHFLVHASVREGWGLNVIEANAMGTPAVVYPVGGLVDSTVHNQTGLVTATETPDAIADALQTLLGKPDEYTRLRQGAWNRSKTFAWSQVLPPACDWLECVASGKQ
jgi:glycosyltransferase involved in cell wall biosynthesis